MTSSTTSHPPRERPKNYFRTLKFVLKLGGINIDGNDSVFYRIYSLLVIVLVNVVYLSLTFLEIFKQEFAVVVEDLIVYVSSFFVATAKVFVLILHRKKFAILLGKLEQAPFIANSERGGELEDKLIRECLWITTFQNKVYWSLACASMIVNSGNSLSKRLKSDDYNDWALPFGPLTVLNITYSPNYEITYIYEHINTIYFAMQFSAADLITASSLAHISYQFKILQVNIRRLVRISYEKMLKETGSRRALQEEDTDFEIEASEIPWRYLKASLEESVQYHLGIIGIAEEMETLFNNLLLTIFLSNLVVLCFMLYDTSLMTLGEPKLWSTAGETIVACLQIATVCFWGEQVVFESQEVGQAAFESNFVGTDLRFQKSLALIIRRSQNPTKLTAGKFSAVALPTFVWFMRTSYSAFMMLRRTQN